MAVMTREQEYYSQWDKLLGDCLIGVEFGDFAIGEQKHAGHRNATIFSAERNGQENYIFKCIRCPLVSADQAKHEIEAQTFLKGTPLAALGVFGVGIPDFHFRRPDGGYPPPNFPAKGLFGFFMPLFPQGDLYSAIRSGVTVNDEVFAIHVAWTVLSCLNHLHARRLVHRDVKPENVFIDASNDGYLGDWATVLYLSEGFDVVPTYPVGTEPYMAPELSEPGKIYNTSIDIWAFGVMLYGMATGQYPRLAHRKDVNYLYDDDGNYYDDECFRVLEEKGKGWRNIGHLGDLLRHILVRPESRWSALKIMGHPFFADETLIERNRLADIPPFGPEE